MLFMRSLSLLFALLVVTVSGCDNKETSTNEGIARSFMEAWSEHDIDKLTALFAEECLYEEVASGRKYTNRKDIGNYASSTISGVPDTKFEIVEIAASGDVALVEWIWKGTNSVGWPDMGIPATNEYFELRGASVLKIEKGLIVRASDYWDWNSFIKGIGAE